MIRVTVWNENHHEKTMEEVRANYPNGIHGYIADFLGAEEDITVRTATLDESECGLTQEVVDNTDVMIWWGHMLHYKVPDEVAARVQNAVISGMGLVALHSSHHSKVFTRLMGTPCSLGWREDGDMERVWTVDPSHPIAQGVGRYFELENEETYTEPFSIPEPEKLVFAGWFEGGELFRAGCCWQRGHGRIFYFQPGHETYPTFHNKTVQLIIKNAVRWCKPVIREPIGCPKVERPQR